MVLPFVICNLEALTRLATLKDALEIKESALRTEKIFRSPCVGETRRIVEGLEASIEEVKRDLFTTPKNKWIAQRFVRGYCTNIQYLKERGTTVTVVPEHEDISREALEICKEGVNYFLNETGLLMTADILSAPIRKISIQAPIMDNITLLHKDLPQYRSRHSLALVAIVASGDHFLTEPRRTAGIQVGSEIVVLERALKKGRFVDEAYLPLDSDEKREYFKTIAAHETRHLLMPNKFEEIADKNAPLDYIGKEDSEFNPDFGYPVEPHCLGISSFTMPTVLCGRCVDGTRAYWYGVEQQTKKQYVTPTSLAI